jgi:ubiquinone/menaquinone biosynthesis C-methylase UbiE
MDYYSQISKSYNELHREEQLNKLSIIKGSIKTARDSRILDVGCGTGISSGFDCFVVGVDPSIKLLNQNKRLKVNSRAENLPFRDRTFDFVISVTSIHNFNDIGKAIGEMKRVGKKDFIFSILKKSGKFNDIKKIIGKNFRIRNVIEEEKDLIFFCEKHKVYI